MEIVVVVDQMDLRIPEEMLRDPTGRFRGDDDILPAVVECHRQFQRCRIGAEIPVVEGRGEKDESPGSGSILTGKQCSHEAPVARTDKDQAALPREALLELGHSLFEGAGAV